MDTVLGLAITPSTIGWVMADAGGSGCPTVIGEEISVAAGDAGVDAVDLAAQASAVAAGVRTMLASRSERLHGVAVTWSDEAAVGAALLLESLADADFEHVVPVRYSQAAASLAGGIGPRHARAAVCVVESGVATLVLPDHPESGEPIVTACPISAVDDVPGWLGNTLASGDQRPEVLMVAGSLRGMDRLGRRLESALSMPVFVQGGAFQALARGAAQTLAPHAELTSARLEAPAAGLATGNVGRRRVRSMSYAAALLMLGAGAVTLVASVAAALSLQLGPGRADPDLPRPQHATVARVAVPAAPPAAAPALPPPAAPAPPAETSEEPPAEFGSLWDAPADPDLQESTPDGVPSLRERVRDHIFGLPGR
ncbi:hypothetical protein [Mycobacterium sp. SMC-19]|uniref:hypothetical protein n=1 Tax=Mycobacterium sp. SMC-19 TaxID=3381630 RepID=UPI003876CD43